MPIIERLFGDGLFFNLLLVLCFVINGVQAKPSVEGPLPDHVVRCHPHMRQSHEAPPHASAGPTDTTESTIEMFVGLGAFCCLTNVPRWSVSLTTLRFVCGYMSAYLWEGV